MLTDPERAWSVLRILRSDPPGSAVKSAHRRRTFTAALDQVEQLWRAAATMPPTASPIVLFYALAQGAAALCAVRIETDGWEAAPAHGLTLLRPTAPSAQVPLLSAIEVQQHGRGLVHQVSTFLRSPVLVGRASLAELLCSLPDSDAFLMPDPDQHPHPLEVFDRSASLGSAAEPSREVEAGVGPLPSRLIRHEKVGHGTTTMVASPPLDDVVAWFSPYPSLMSAGRPTEIGYVNPTELTWNPTYHVRVRWTLPEPIAWGESRDWFHSIVDVILDDEPGATTRGLVLPAVGGNTTAQHPLIGWWTVLYALSMLARYHPRTWVALLDLDSSRSAVPLDLVLKTAHALLPSLLLEEMTTDRDEPLLASTS